MWFIRFYDGFLTSTLKFLLGFNNTTLGLVIMMITFFFYLKGNHDGALWFGGVATTLLGIKGGDSHNTTDAPNAKTVTNNISGDTPNA